LKVPQQRNIPVKKAKKEINSLDENIKSLYSVLADKLTKPQNKL